MKPIKGKIPIHAWLPAALVGKLKRLAKREDCTQTALIRQAITTLLADFEP